MGMSATSCYRIHSLGIYSTQEGEKVRSVIILYPHVLSARHASVDKTKTVCTTQLNYMQKRPNLHRLRLNRRNYSGIIKQS